VKNLLWGAVTLLLTLSQNAQAGIIIKDNVRSNVHIISVGVDDYSPEGNGYRFHNCESDALAFTDHVKKDIEKKKLQALHGTTLIRSISSHYYSKIDSVYEHTLLGKKATLDNIRDAFMEVISSANKHDYFFFFFAGITRETSPIQTVLIPYQTYSMKEDSIVLADCIDMTELSGFMEQISCNNQMIISESGMGEDFAKNLIGHLFESNALVAQHSQRNRMVITTNGLGQDAHYCEKKYIGHGPLMSYILSSEDILLAFGNPEGYELQLNTQEARCPHRNKKYFSFYEEKKYTDFLLRHQSKSGMRGGKATKIQKDEDTTVYNPPKDYAFIVATNEYKANNTWENLRNPINDAEKIATLLRERFEVEVSLLKNMSYDEILDSMDRVQDKLDSNDRFIFFIAGHGYYKAKNRSSYLVFNDSKPFEEDPSMRHSYMHMSTLNHRLNYMPCKQVLAIFDVCFGAQFNPAGEDLHLNDYDKLEADHHIDTFINRKNQYTSRIFMASGRYEVPDYWSSSSDHSPFAKKLIHALKSEEDFVSPGKIFAQLEANATEPVLRRFGDHHPRGDFLLKVMASSTR